MSEELVRLLERVGLTGNEAGVFLVLLRSGSSRAGRISKASGINRTTTYDTLKQLLAKGLVNYVVKENRKWFQATNPKRLLEMLREKEEDAREIMPKLVALSKSPEERHNVTLYYGYKGIKTVFQDIVREGKPNCVLDSEGKFTEKMQHYARYLIKQLEKRKIPIKHIVKEGVDIKPSKTTKVRFVPKTEKTSAATNIYGDKIAIIVWTEPPEAVIIQNKEAAESYRFYFNMLWKMAKK
jgi:sugar-specific transcriptional regulator TrmB